MLDGMVVPDVSREIVVRFGQVRSGVRGWLHVRQLLGAYSGLLGAVNPLSRARSRSAAGSASASNRR